MNRCIKIVLIGSLMATSAVATAADEKKDSPWKTTAELGFISTTGNTETKTTTGKLDTVYEVEKWRHTGHLEGYGQQSKDTNTDEMVVSAERYEASGKSDYKFTERDYAYGLVKLIKDRFSGFEYENTLGLGYGRKVIKDPAMQLDLEIGPGARFYREDIADAESKNEATLRLSGNFWWAITENSKFLQELLTEIGEEFTASKSVTGLQANINKTLAMKFTYTVRHKTKVPVGTEKTDTEAAMTLVYNF
ncbi:MAG TPA: DUF481 domain-containing protein [Gammaproteobacteria bacterium]|nr:DUF481 domain-containing protein [Gammaproteobacteria bacterium]